MVYRDRRDDRRWRRFDPQDWEFRSRQPLLDSLDEFIAFWRSALDWQTLRKCPHRPSRPDGWKRFPVVAHDLLRHVLSLSDRSRKHLVHKEIHHLDHEITRRRAEKLECLFILP